jgi:tetratricopeptide (TPR) repeat protein
VLIVLTAVGLTAWGYASGRPAWWRARAEVSERAGDWPSALAAWRVVNAGPEAQGSTLLAQARAAMALGQLAEAEQAAHRATVANPSGAAAWRLWLELLRVEDRMTDAQGVGWAALDAVPPADRRAVLRDLTLALLAEVPDDVARPMLTRWASAAAADPGPELDVDARVALLQRMGAMPRGGEPDRGARVAELTAVLARAPGHLPAREALVSALADGGEPDRGRQALEAWPETGRDARYWRLRGRWELEYDHQPDRAWASFRRTLNELPHDWKTHVRLARALRALHRAAEARSEAETVARLRERLDPATLGPRLTRGDPADLADLAATVGLTRLADAWRSQAATP